MEVRTGKTATSLSMVSLLPVTNCLFVTKKKAISSIESDYQKLNHTYNLLVINYESLHKVPSDVSWDVLICDEAHTLGAFPKKSKRARQIMDILLSHEAYTILLSGTPTPESYSQMYHQVCGISNNPFRKFKNFYAFAKTYVDVRQRKINGNYINDYSKGCLLYTSPSPRDLSTSRMPSSA